MLTPGIIFAEQMWQLLPALIIAWAILQYHDKGPSSPA